jgi:hypothetical protein
MAIKDREFDLFVVGPEIDEKVIDLIDNFLGSGVLAVDLIDEGECKEVLVPGLF